MAKTTITFDADKFITELTEVNMPEAQAKIVVEMYLAVLNSHVGVKNEPRLVCDTHRFYENLIKAKMPSRRAEVLVRQYFTIFNIVYNTTGGYDSIEILPSKFA